MSTEDPPFFETFRSRVLTRWAALFAPRPCVFNKDPPSTLRRKAPNHEASARALALLMLHFEACRLPAGVRLVFHCRTSMTVPRVSRSCEYFPCGPNSIRKQIWMKPVRALWRSSCCISKRAGSLRASRLGRVDPSFRALSGRLQFTVRRHKCNQDSLRAGQISYDSLTPVRAP